MILERFHAGGPFMYVILLCAIFAVACIFERVRALYGSRTVASKKFREKILRYLREGRLDEAKSYVQEFARWNSLASIVDTGLSLRANGGGEEEIQARMDEKLTQEISKLDKNTGFLAMIGNVSTLLGLLGTISGLIYSFTAVASANPAERALLLSKGISEALNATAFGLVIAVVSLVAYAILQNRTNKLITSLTEETTQIYHDLLFLTESEKKRERK